MHVPQTALVGPVVTCIDVVVIAALRATPVVMRRVHGAQDGVLLVGLPVGNRVLGLLEPLLRVWLRRYIKLLVVRGRLHVGVDVFGVVCVVGYAVVLVFPLVPAGSVIRGLHEFILYLLHVDSLLADGLQQPHDFVLLIAVDHHDAPLLFGELLQLLVFDDQHFYLLRLYHVALGVAAQLAFILRFFEGLTKAFVVLLQQFNLHFHHLAFLFEQLQLPGLCSLGVGTFAQHVQISYNSVQR